MIEKKLWFRANDSRNVEAHIFNKPVLQVAESKKASSPVYKDMAYIEIRIKGQSQIVIRPLQEKDIERFPDAWKHYQGEEVKVATGTPIEQLEGIQEGQVVALRSRGIHYIEDLGHIQPEMIQGLGLGIWHLQKQAQKYLGIESPEKIAFTVKEENETLRQENDQLKDRLSDLEAKMAVLLDAKQEKKSPKKKKTTKEEDV